MFHFKLSGLTSMKKQKNRNLAKIIFRNFDPAVVKTKFPEKKKKKKKMNEFCSSPTKLGQNFGS